MGVLFSFAFLVTSPFEVAASLFRVAFFCLLKEDDLNEWIVCCVRTTVERSDRARVVIVGVSMRV